MLPLQFNDGRDVPPEWLTDAVLEIVDRFGTASYETQKIEWQWRVVQACSIATISCGSS